MEPGISLPVVSTTSLPVTPLTFPPFPLVSLTPPINTRSSHLPKKSEPTCSIAARSRQGISRDSSTTGSNKTSKGAAISSTTHSPTLLEPFNKLYNTFPAPHLKSKTRSEEVLMAQLRTGHCRIARAYLCRIGLAQSELCECGQKETVGHIIATCPLHSSARAEAFSSIPHPDISVLFSHPSEVVSYLLKIHRLRFVDGKLDW